MDLSRYNQALEQYADTLGPLRVEMLSRIWEIQERRKPQIDWEPESDEKILKRLERNKALLGHRPPQMDLDWFKETFAEIIDVLKDYAADKDSALMNADISKIKMRDIKYGVLFSTDVVRKVTKRLGIPTNDNAQLGLTALAVLSAIRPFSRAVADNVDYDFLADDIPPSESCPVCANSAALAVVDGDGEDEPYKRRLYCSNCETQWHYPKGYCTECGKVEEEDYRYFYYEDDPAHRMYFCRRCSTALPTVFSHYLDGILVERVEESVALPLMYSVLKDQDVEAFIEGSE